MAMGGGAEKGHPPRTTILLSAERVGELRPFCRGRSATGATVVIATTVVSVAYVGRLSTAPPLFLGGNSAMVALIPGMSTCHYSIFLRETLAGPTRGTA